MDNEELLQEARNRINNHSYGEIRKVKCSVRGSAVILEGSVSSYFYKQLAQQAVMGINGNTVENAISVKAKDEGTT